MKYDFRVRSDEIYTEEGEQILSSINLVWIVPEFANEPIPL